MKCDIILAGVGGQGIQTLAALLARAALDTNLQARQSGAPDYAQRGGAVESHVRLSAEAIFTDRIPRGHADIVCGLEPLEALRQINCLSPSGWIVACTDPVSDIADYPPIETVLGELRAQKQALLVPATSLAKTAGAPRAMNMVMLGAASAFIPKLEETILLALISQHFENQGSLVVDVNRKAFAAGRQHAQTEARR